MLGGKLYINANSLSFTPYKDFKYVIHKFNNGTYQCILHYDNNANPIPLIVGNLFKSLDYRDNSIILSAENTSGRESKLSTSMYANCEIIPDPSTDTTNNIIGNYTVHELKSNDPKKTYKNRQLLNIYGSTVFNSKETTIYNGLAKVVANKDTLFKDIIVSNDPNDNLQPTLYIPLYFARDAWTGYDLNIIFSYIYELLEYEIILFTDVIDTNDIPNNIKTIN